MGFKLLGALAVGTLLSSTALAQTTGGVGAMTSEDRQELERVFEQAGFTDFRMITTGDADTQVFEATTAAGRTILIMVPGTTGGTGDGETAASTTTGDGNTTGGTTGGDNAGATTAADAGAATGGGDAGGTTAGAEGGDGEPMTMNVDLSGREQVPPVETSGTGQVQVTFDSDSRELSWKLDYSDLSSEATAAHFHGPADPGETAPPVIPLDEFSDGAEGSATLTEEQAEQLMGGKMYFNLHTENNPNGEIRGQVTQAQ